MEMNQITKTEEIVSVGHKSDTFGQTNQPVDGSVPGAGLLLNRKVLGQRHYVVTGTGHDYFTQFTHPKLSRFRARYSNNFCLIIARNSNEAGDFFAIPFSSASEGFVEERLQETPRSTGHVVRRWVCHIRGEMLEISKKGMASFRLDVREFRGNPAPLERCLQASAENPMFRKNPMKTVMISSGSGLGELGLCSQAPIALAILQQLSAAPQAEGLTAEELIDGLAAVGVLFSTPNERNAIKSLLDRLKSAHLVQNPAVSGGSRRYIRTSLSISLRL